ncbi:hypothetical protein [Deinococcus alpinitundrae]|uniref:hypothetical protein n=1 Tax=Deinococcus alpinitundrae TaxID=468913 RepID=UPI00137B6E8F|nr:hypothetical protein [Deinococcus alpinitundrae]
MKRTAALLTALLLLGSAQAQELGLPDVPAQIQADPQTTTLDTVSTNAPEVLRASSVSLTFEAPIEARELVVAHSLPLGAQYLPGSAALDGKPVADPLLGSQNRLYWVLPAEQSGTLSYHVTYSGQLGELAAPALLARYGAQRSEVLRGDFDQADFVSAQPISARSASKQNAGAVKLPLDGTIYRIRDRITVIVEGPLDAVLTPSINGVALREDQIGTRTTDSANNKQRLEYVGAPLKPGPNLIQLGSDTVTVRYASVTTRVVVTPIQLIADGNSVVRLKLQAYDAFGTLSSVPSLTVTSNLEPSTPDADPSTAGYQVRMNDGVGEVVLAPQSSPTTLTLSVLVDSSAQVSSFELKPNASRVGVGVISATLGLPDFKISLDNLSYLARASLETPLLGGKLYLTADKDGLPTSENVYQRYASYGDSSTDSTPLQGIDPVALIYDQPSFRVSYRQGALPGDVLPLGETFTALRVQTKNAGPQVAAYVAYVPSDKVSARLIPEGRLLHLQPGVAPDSESLTVVTLDKTTGVELKRVPLTRLADYTLDTDSGVVTFNQTLDPLDADLNDVRLDVIYRLVNPLSQRTLSYGAQIWQQTHNYGVGAAVVNLDGVSTYGVRANYAADVTRAGLLAAYSGGVQLSAVLDHRFSKDSSVSAQARYQSASYAGLSPLNTGLSVVASYKTRLSSRLAAVLDGEYHNTPTAAAAPLADQVSAQGGSVTARADYNLKPFSVGGGFKYAFGDVYGLGAVGSVGYHQGAVDLDVVHTQPLSGNLKAVTDVSAKVKVAENVVLGLRDTYTWNGSNVASLSTATKLGNVNYAVTYDLPNADGSGNRARFGADTSIPLSAQFSLGLRGSVVRAFNTAATDLSAGADLRYQGSNMSGSVGSDVSYQNNEFGAVFRAGLTGSLSPALTLSADSTAEVGHTQGLRAAFGYAYRAGDLNSLGYLRYAAGSLAGANPEITAGLSAEYHRTQYALRAGLDARELLSDSGSLTLQPSLGATAYIGERFGVSGWGRALIQPASGSAVYGYGLEGSLRALPGTWLTAGYNFAGFDGTGNQYTKQGAYVRLDVTLDDSLGERK